MRLSQEVVCLGTTVLSLVSAVEARRVPALFQVLQNAGASQFANQLQGDPYLMDMLTSGEVGTLFAPVDPQVASRLRVRNPVRRDTNLTTQQDLAYQVSQEIEAIKNSTKPTFRVVQTARRAAKLDGSSQNIVLNVTDQVNATGAFFRRGLNGVFGYGDPGSFAEISTGFGNIVNIIQPDLEFARCGGSSVVHLVDKCVLCCQEFKCTANDTPVTLHYQRISLPP